MKKTTKRSKKKVVSKPKPVDNNDAKCTLPTKEQVEPLKEPQQHWTRLQIEQAELAKQLDYYIGEFQQKLLRLNFVPSDRELVILFIMNLHPRFRRFVEPVELSYSSWVEAAAFARHHCTRISAILGCERHDSDPMFKSPEAKALIDSGYFVSANSPSVSMYPGADAINHLLVANSVILEQSKPASTESKIASTESKPAATESKPASAESKPTSAASKPTSAASKPTSAESKITSTESKPAAVAAEGSASATVSASASSSSSAAGVIAEETIVEEEKKEKDKEKQDKGATEGILYTNLSNLDKNAEELKELLYKEDEGEENNTKTKSTTDGPSPITKAEVQTRIQQAVKNKKDKEKEKEKKFSLPRVTAVKSNGSLNNSKSVCYRVPEEHAGVNLTFLELTINDKKVKGLLAKLRWGSSAMSLDCVKRLGLDMKETDNFCIHTDFGYEDTIGIMKLPIIHPADPNIKSELEIQVLPMIYAGKIDLVLGADFFYFFNPTLNIKTRAIRFLDKETPYIVGKIE